MKSVLKLPDPNWKSCAEGRRTRPNQLWTPSSPSSAQHTALIHETYSFPMDNSQLLQLILEDLNWLTQKSPLPTSSRFEPGVLVRKDPT